ncbi:hypothetical protein C464_10968 [Halorubrum coriense DSM 10284]|uniref:Uncharacterized protein n=1 Tax=Halorubrum coriense DSM 10284 TaxID=1227466 RepID=M0EEW2_9EURY|nr:hypothetical protein [Halorubrum coriense]ELZ46331.1 hypothetical protein C464_10968 [Halorubrum coriense DSM 10284]
MSGRPTKLLVVLIAACLLALGGIVAVVHETTGSADLGDGATVADGPDGERASPADARRQTDDGPDVIEPGETSMVCTASVRADMPDGGVDPNRI